MGKIINEVLSFKFYDLKTGEEIPPYVAPPKDEQKEQELEKLRKQTGYYFPELCPSCGQYYEGYDGHYELNGDVKCKHCIKSDDRLKLPFFAPEIPNYVEGATRRMFTFTDENDLYDKIKSKLCEGDILVKTKDGCIMSQSITKSHWWVLGYINNYDMGLLNIPTFDSNVYNNDETINASKMDKWLKGKDIIKGNKDED